MPPTLPVDSFIGTIAETLDRTRAVVVTAAPGAGKTTRIPPAMIDRGRVLLLQPRRVAARAMARRIASERGWTIGNEIGWHIRFERRFSRETRLLVVTEGILTVYLQNDPLLSDITTVIIDEFHERSIHADLGLALVKQAWLARSDLRIVVMSATLDTKPVSAFLEGCPVIDIPGMLHPVAIDYAPTQTVGDAVRDLLPKTNGNVLCFLPGVREIATAIQDCSSLSSNVDVVPLHGSLDAAAQDLALSADLTRRRLIMATNVAETSLTVPGVSVVIDTGLHKVARYDAERGVDALTLERVTLDSADQRAGRSARLGPGTVRRLWDSRDRLRPHREPEIDRADLAGPLLAVLVSGASPDTFEWFDPPLPDRVAASLELLRRLGAVEGNRATLVGQKMQRVSLPPRIARIFLQGFGAPEVCRACAWLAEPTRLFSAPATTSDLLIALDRWSQMPGHLHQVATQLERLAAAALGDKKMDHASEVQLRSAVLTGYPDRVARRRSADKVTLASGHGAVIGRESGVHNAEWLVALDVTAARTSANTEAIIRVASEIDAKWLTPTHSTAEQEVDAAGTIKARKVDWYDALVLAEQPIGMDVDMTATVLAAAWLERGGDKQTARLMRRIRFAGLDVDITDLVFEAARSASRVQDITVSEDQLSWDVRKRLARDAPDMLTVPSGRAMMIEYADDGGVSVSVKLQELFGLAESPRLGPARTPVTFHLLAPNGRPVQTTQDLKSFWERTYPEVRKELRGRYPRHPWPDDPWNATPTHRTTKRAR